MGTMSVLFSLYSISDIISVLPLPRLLFFLAGSWSLFEDCVVEEWVTERTLQERLDLLQPSLSPFKGLATNIRRG